MACVMDDWMVLMERWRGVWIETDNKGWVTDGQRRHWLKEKPRGRPQPGICPATRGGGLKTK